MMTGLTVVASDWPVKEAVKRMVAIIEQQGWHLFARIDHADHARRKGLSLRPTELLLFGNPEIGTLLMQKCQIAAIDLPMKVLAWEDEQGQVNIAHNSTQWLKDRHGLTDEGTLKAIEAILARLRAGVQRHQ